jgi:hypothetical protein
MHLGVCDEVSHAHALFGCMGCVSSWCRRVFAGLSKRLFELIEILQQQVDR